MVGKVTRACILYVGFVCAQNTSLHISVTDIDGGTIAQLTAGVPFCAHVRVDGDADHEPTLVRQQELAECKRVRVGTHITVTNGVQQINKTYTYRCRVDQPGSLVLGPAFIDVGTQRYQSAAVSFPVLPASAQQKQPRRDLELQVRVNKQTAYVGQQLLLNAQLLVRVPVSLTRCALQDTAIVGARIGQALEPVQEKNGALVRVSYRTFMYPERPGTLTIPALTALCEQEVADQRTQGWPFRAFFGVPTQTVRVQSNPLEITVKPLPPSARKPDGVGDFWDYTIKPGAHEFSTARAATLTVSLAGAADLQTVSLPLRVSDGLRVYQSRATIVPDEKKIGVARKTVEYVVQALRPGTFTIDAHTFYFFDPQSGVYKTLKTAPCTVRASGPIAPEKAAPSDGVRSVPLAHKSPILPVRNFHWLVTALVMFLLSVAVLLLGIAGARYVPVRIFFRRVRSVYMLRRRVLRACKKNDCADVYQAWRDFYASLAGVVASCVTHEDLELLKDFVCATDEQKTSWRAYVSRMHACVYGGNCSDDALFKTSMQWIGWRSWWRVSAIFCILDRSSKLNTMK